MLTPTNIRLLWKLLTVPNTVAYYHSELITAVKSFIVQSTWLFSLLSFPLMGLAREY